MPKVAGPPGTRRKKLAVPIPRTRTWCMCCLRVGDRDWEEQPDSIRMPFKVGCVSDTANSKTCAHCTKHHKVCESAEHFWLTDEGGYGIRVDKDDTSFALGFGLVGDVSVAVRDLIASFDNLVRNHNHLHHLAGTRVPIVSRPLLGTDSIHALAFPTISRPPQWQVEYSPVTYATDVYEPSGSQGYGSALSVSMRQCMLYVAKLASSQGLVNNQTPATQWLVST
ncbi:hypothetical protein PENFLA_c015G10527 [Penicillium flavigenum]|uniref:Uncharacterized protein n=1 Tax=Penicillium flavigenum TaxID=254877 RepID=A0A1V6T4H2_9EURO|nr:hypothetical protein PENFLA_c015G10527 [Penicillium flavigenum]